MKRYIEIVYDNSGSMTDFVGGKKKYEIAQELFKKEILPSIGLRGDHVVLRLLGDGCKDSISTSEILPNQRNQMLERIREIKHDKMTPLFYTVSDSVEACRNVRADKCLIFVLTDGDDTCGVRIEDVLDEDTVKKFIRYYDVKLLLAQLAINSSISRNNLTAFTNALGGQTISLDSSDSIPKMRKKLKVALNTSGFTNKFPLEHCFDTLPGLVMTWEEVEETGINFHQAMLLYQKGLLTWLPDFNIGVSALQFAELRFLFSLLFKSGIPEDLLKTMLAQLKKPYYYTFDCIYWDFSSARWRYFIPQNKISQVSNPDAKNQDGIFNNVENDKTDKIEQIFYQFETYQVQTKDKNLEIANFVLNPDYVTMNDIENPIELRTGDLVRFR